MANEDPPAEPDAALVVVANDAPPARPAPTSPRHPVPAQAGPADPPTARTPAPAAPEDIAPEWWTAMSRTDGDAEPERIGRIPYAVEPEPLAPPRRSLGMPALATLLGVLVFAGVLTHLLS